VPNCRPAGRHDPVGANVDYPHAKRASA
jgi:hypothetical protein